LKGDLKKTLLGMGFSKKESQVYIYLGKTGPQKGSAIAKWLKINKGQVYRTLKTLQKKGVVESTLEYPARFTAVPLEHVIDSFIKSKREEVDHIEETKKDLISDWNEIRQIQVDSTLEKFGVIEGEKNVFHKISQMVKEAKKEVLTIVSVNALVKADHYGLFDDIEEHPLKNNIKFRFLTQITKNDLKGIKIILKKIKPDLDFKGKDPDRSSAICPRIVIKDRNEILIFISDKNNSSLSRKIDAILCTNSKSIVNSFYSVFQQLWSQGKPLSEKITELETGKPSKVMELIKNPEIARTKFFASLDKAKKEVLIVVSPKRFDKMVNDIEFLRNLCKKEVSIKILTTITTENLSATQELLTYAEVKHIPLGYKETTIIDGRELFQFHSSLQSGIKGSGALTFKNVFFTNDSDYIDVTRKHLLLIWKKTHFPYEKITSVNTSNPLWGHHCLEEKSSFMENMQYQLNEIDEKKIIKKINEEKKKVIPNKSYDWSSEIRYFGTRAFALFPSIQHLSLPKMIIGVVYHDENSSFGVENWLVVNLLQETEKGSGIIPVAFVQDSEKHVSFRKKIFKGFPVADNIIVFGKGELKIQIKGKCLFTGWTKKIPLGVDDLYLPPGSLLFEGYGEVKPGMFTNVVPSGRKQEVYYNSFDAFVTFFCPKSQYVGSGIEAFIERENGFISTANT